MATAPETSTLPSGAEQPNHDDRDSEQSGCKQPAAGQSASEQPLSAQPLTEESVGQCGDQAPEIVLTEQSAHEQPAAKQPAIEQPALEQPSDEQPATKPSVADPDLATVQEQSSTSQNADETAVKAQAGNEASSEVTKEQPAVEDATAEVGSKATPSSEALYVALIEAVCFDLGLASEEDPACLNSLLQLDVYHNAAKLFECADDVCAALQSPDEAAAERLPARYRSGVAAFGRSAAAAAGGPAAFERKRLFGPHAVRFLDLPVLPGAASGACVCIRDPTALHFDCAGDALADLERREAAVTLTIRGTQLVISPLLPDLNDKLHLATFISNDKLAWRKFLLKFSDALGEASLRFVQSTLADAQASAESGWLVGADEGQKVYATLLSAVFRELDLYEEGGWLDIKKQILVYYHASQVFELRESILRALAGAPAQDSDPLPAAYRQAITAVRQHGGGLPAGVGAKAVFGHSHAIRFKGPPGVPLGGRRDLCLYLRELPLSSGYGTRKTASWFRHLLKFKCPGNPLDFIEEPGLGLVLSVEKEIPRAFLIISSLFSKPEAVEAVMGEDWPTMTAKLRGHLTSLVSEHAPGWARFVQRHADCVQKESLRTIQKALTPDSDLGLGGLEKLEKEARELCQAEAQAKSELEGVMERLEELHDESDMLREMNRELKRERRDDEEALSLVKRAKHGAREKLAAAQKKVDDLEAALALEVLAVKPLQEADDEATAKIARLTEEYKVSKPLLEEIQAAKETIAAAQETIATLNTLKADVAAAKDEAAQAKREAEEADERAKERVAKATSTAALIRKMASKYASAAEKASADSLMEATRARAELETKTKAADLLSAANVELRAEAMRAREEAKRAYDKAVSATSSAFESQDAEAAACAELDARCTASAALDAKEQVLSAELAAAKAEAQSSERRAATSEIAIKKARMAGDKACAESQAAAEEVAQLREQQALVIEEVAKLREQLPRAVHRATMVERLCEEARAEATRAANRAEAMKELTSDSLSRLSASHATLQSDAKVAQEAAHVAQQRKTAALADLDAARASHAAKVAASEEVAATKEATAEELNALRTKVDAARKMAAEFTEVLQRASKADEESKMAESLARVELEAKGEEARRLTADIAQVRAQAMMIQESLPKPDAVAQATSKNISLHMDAEKMRMAAREAEARAKSAEDELASLRQSTTALETELEVKLAAAKNLEATKEAAEAETKALGLAAEEASERISAAQSAEAMAKEAEARISAELDAKAAQVARLKAALAARGAGAAASPAKAQSRSRTAACSEFEPTPPKRRRLSKGAAPDVKDVGKGAGENALVAASHVE